MNVIAYSKIKDKNQYRRMLRRLKKLQKHGKIVKIRNVIIVEDKELMNSIVEQIVKSCNNLKVYIALDRWLK